MAADYFHILVFLIVGLLFGVASLVMAQLVRIRGRRLNRDAYECGMPSVGTPWVSPNIRFTVFALLFVIFDAEALFVFPWAVHFRELGMEGLAAVLIFVGLLFVGLVFAWRAGSLSWE